MSPDLGVPARSSARPPATGLLEANRAAYREVLAQVLPPEFQGFVPFFANLRRLRTLAACIDRHFSGEDRLVLNVGCGPFAIEVFLAALERHRIISFDYTEAFARAYPALRRRGFLGNTSFLRADIGTVAFRPGCFDLIVMNDVLYEPSLSLPDLLPRLDGLLRPGGLIYFDVANEAARWLYRMLGRDHGFRRYRLAEVMRLLEAGGYAILAVDRAQGARSPPVAAAEAALWRLAGFANSMAFMARKQVR